MKILIVADIHGNWPALRAVVSAERFDRCLVLGDLVDYGPDPVPCIEWVARHAWVCIRGNHDHAVAQGAPCVGSQGYRLLSSATRPWSWRQLAAQHYRFLAGMPITARAQADGCRFLLVHATPRDPLEEYAPPDLEVWRRRLERIEANIVCVGHTHVPFVMQCDGKLVVNPGSVGQPRDGDPRASYATWEDGVVTLHRAEYAVDETLQRIVASDLPEPAKTLTMHVLTQGRLPSLNGHPTGVGET
ncbi:MAG: YfcE family phosphodiesterase [Gemmataceae bacterium]